MEPLLSSERFNKHVFVTTDSRQRKFYGYKLAYISSRGDSSRSNRFVYDYTTKLCRKQAEAIRNHENEHVRGLEQGEAKHRKYKKLELGGDQTYDRSSD
jgi:hypothetical protein